MYKKLIVFSVFFISCYSTKPQESRLIKLMDTIIESQNYWTLLSTTPLQRALNRPMTSWFNQSWKQEIPGHLEALKKAEIIAAQTLGKLKNNSPVDTQTAITEVASLITSHTKPSHFSRNWIKYCTLFAAAYALYHYGQKHQKELLQLVYDEDGNNKLSFFLSKHVYKPAKEMFENTFAIKSTVPKDLHLILQEALKSEHYKELFASIDLTQLSFDDKKDLADAIINKDFTHKWHMLGRAIGGHTLFGVNLLKLQIKEITENLQLVKSMLMLTPACFLGWGGYKATITALQSRYNNVVLTPLQQDIYALEDLFYQNYSTPFTDDYFLGMRTYWLTKLKTYLPKLRTKEKEKLNRTIEHLTQNTSIDNQLNIIRAILQYNSF